MYILLVYERELSKDDYLRPLLITIIKSIKKLIKEKNYPKKIFNASSSARRLWNLLHSSAIPPVLVKTNGVNVQKPLPKATCCIASSHFHVVGISVSETVLDTNLRLDGTPEH